MFLPVVYGFFIACLVVFYVVFRADAGMAVAVPAFFIWVSVFNLFVVSVFWSFMSDIFTTDQAKRLYGIIAAGGTCGALAGPGFTALLVERIGVPQLMLISALLLGGRSWRSCGCCPGPPSDAASIARSGAPCSPARDWWAARRSCG